MTPMAQDGRHRWDRGPEPADRCAGIRQAISALADGEATEIERAVVQRHAAGCAPCRRFQREALMIADELRVARLLEPSRSLAPAPRDRRRRLRRPLAVAGSVATVGAAALLGALISSQVDRSPGAPPAAELRLANLDTRQAQLYFQHQHVQALRALPASDPTLDRDVQRRQLG